MLSVGKLGVGQEDYYLQAVARSAADYYLGAGEAPGYWLGAGSARLGLTGEVTAEQLRHAILGNHPRTGLPLAERWGVKRRPGFDITFSAPKSASLLYALGDEATSAAVRRAHDAAVADAVGYLERTACKVRRGKGGVQQLDGGGFVSAAFRQRTSRAGDPQLHTQLVTANMAVGPDGRWTALDGRLIYLHGKTAGTLYRASFRWRMARELGVSWLMRSNGLAEVDGFPAGVLRRFSQRRRQVEERMAERGESSATAAQVATLATRDRKSDVPPYNELLPLWRQAADELGLDDAAIRAALGRSEPVAATRVITAEVRAALLGPEGLTEHRASFDRRDVVQALCKVLPDGATVAEVEALADELIRHRDVIPLLPGRDRTTAAGGLADDQAVRVDGRPAGAALAGHRRYTTADLLAAETAVLTRADSGRNAGVGVATDDALAAAFARRPTLSAEQQRMVRQLTTSGAMVDVVVGKAGTGKTFALDAARDAWHGSGQVVVGAALAARAAAELQAGSGIPSGTITRLLGDIDRAGGLPAGCVVVLDEAGMVGTRDLNRLTAHVAAAGGKLVAVGDPRQLPEIDAGGIFRALATRHSAVELVENRRQVDPWERVALDELRHGDVPAAVEAFDIAGRIVVGDTAEDTRRLLVDAWYGDHREWELIPAESPDKKLHPVMRAIRRDDVADLNARGRALLAAAGRLTGPEVLTADGHRFASGDMVMLLKNRYKYGLLNGDVGHVLAADPDRRTLTVQLARGQVRVPAWYLDDGHVTYAYARTIHKSQGETSAKTRLLGDEALYREAGYTGLSRARHLNTLYITAPADDAGRDGATPPDPFAAITRSLARSRAQRSAHDELAPEDTAPRLDLRRHSDKQLQALVATGQRVERNQPPDVRGRLTATKSERDWLDRRLAQDRAKLAALRDELDRTGPLARGQRRELKERIEILERGLPDATRRVADLDEQIADLARAHTRRLTWEQTHRPERDLATRAREEIERRASDRSGRDEDRQPRDDRSRDR